MSIIDEAAGFASPLNAALRAGLENIDRGSRVIFTKYVKVILPLDGFTFWVKADLLSASALYNASQFNRTAINAAPIVITPAATIEVSGSMHYATDTMQDETVTKQRNRMIFTSEQDIDFFNEEGPMVLYIGEWDGVRFSFSSRSPLYAQADIYHYVGDAIYPEQESQIIDNKLDLDTRDVVVSNSLPIWLTLNQYMPMYPSYLVTPNMQPPYAAVHIEPNDTAAIQSAPLIGMTSDHTQLVFDRVRITMYGLRSDTALDFVDYVYSYTLNTDNFGIMNMPVIRDTKRTQAEMTVIAMEKTIEFEINYYQTRLREIARQYILSAMAQVTGKPI